MCSSKIQKGGEGKWEMWRKRKRQEDSNKCRPPPLHQELWWLKIWTGVTLYCCEMCCTVRDRKYEKEAMEQVKRLNENQIVIQREHWIVELPTVLSSVSLKTSTQRIKEWLVLPSLFIYFLQGAKNDPGYYKLRRFTFEKGNSWRKNIIKEDKAQKLLDEHNTIRINLRLLI